MKFEPGQSGNPFGRPRGSRNKASIIAEQLLEGEIEAITRTAIEKAKNGNATALRLCLERLLPVRKDRPLELDLPALRRPADAVTAMAAVADALAAGDVTAPEAQALGKMVQAFADVLVRNDLAERIERLENNVKT